MTYFFIETKLFDTGCMQLLFGQNVQSLHLLVKLLICQRSKYVYRTLCVLYRMNCLCQVSYRFLRIKLFRSDISLPGCQPGYHSSNCSELCPYPSYGDRCQGICDCDEISCDVSTGCWTPTTGSLSFNNKHFLKKK